jgi:hypothetical protein
MRPLNWVWCRLWEARILTGADCQEGEHPAASARQLV